MRLVDFIRQNHERIVAEWESFARSLVPPPQRLSASVLRDHAEEILHAIEDDMSSYQSPEEQAAKSRGRGEDVLVGGAGKTHAAIRIESGFRLEQLVAEYRALRASVLRLWMEGGDGRDLDGLVRFNEAVDEALTHSTRRYREMMERHRDEFLGILGHDLRNPMSAIIMGATLLVRTKAADADVTRVASGILKSGRRMDRMIGDLLDLTRTRLGAGIPIVVAPLDLGDVCRQAVGELEAAHPSDRVRLTCTGDLRGEWDGDRLAQVVSNLVGNAIQHGTRHGPIRIDARGEGHDVVISVHNEGPPIPQAALSDIFEPMARGGPQGQRRPSSLGLGLYIARQVVGAHGGRITVASTKGEGTTFRARLPRHPPR